MYTTPKKPLTNSLQKAVHNFMDERSWEYWSKEKIIRKLREELEEAIVEVKAGKNKKLKVEVGDVIFALCCLCFVKKINMDEALHEALMKFRERDKKRYLEKTKSRS